MEQLFEFATNHSILVMVFLVLVAILIGGEFSRLLSGVKEVEPANATRMINHDNAVLVDMRPEKDFSNGHIANALHVPSSDNLGEGKLTGQKQSPIIVYCRSGQQSSHYCNRLKKQGYETVYNLKGGIQAWQQANLPLNKAG
jgi:rhodanese-related sulfurtransferase